MDDDVARRLAELESRVAELEEQVARVPGISNASAEVRDLVAKGKLITAIKIYRRESGASLLQAKNYIESLAGR